MFPDRAQTITAGTGSLRLTGRCPHTVCYQPPEHCQSCTRNAHTTATNPRHPPTTVCAHDEPTRHIVGGGRGAAPTRPGPTPGPHRRPGLPFAFQSPGSGQTVASLARAEEAAAPPSCPWVATPLRGRGGRISHPKSTRPRSCVAAAQTARCPRAVPHPRIRRTLRPVPTSRCS